MLIVEGLLSRLVNMVMLWFCLRHSSNKVLTIMIHAARVLSLEFIKSMLNHLFNRKNKHKFKMMMIFLLINFQQKMFGDIEDLKEAVFHLTKMKFAFKIGTDQETTTTQDIYSNQLVNSTNPTGKEV